MRIRIPTQQMVRFVFPSSQMNPSEDNAHGIAKRTNALKVFFHGLLCVEMRHAIGAERKVHAWHGNVRALARAANAARLQGRRAALLRHVRHGHDGHGLVGLCLVLVIKVAKLTPEAIAAAVIAVAADTLRC